MQGMGMPMHIHQSLLGDAQKRNGGRPAGNHAIAQVAETYLQSSPRRKSANQISKRIGQAVTIDLGRIMKECEGADLPIDLPGGILDFAEQFVLDRSTVRPLQLGNI